jgi:hypothetical protein
MRSSPRHASRAGEACDAGEPLRRKADLIVKQAREVPLGHPYASRERSDASGSALEHELRDLAHAWIVGGAMRGTRVDRV